MLLLVVVVVVSEPNKLRDKNVRFSTRYNKIRCNRFGFSIAWGVLRRRQISVQAFVERVSRRHNRIGITQPGERSTVQLAA